MKRIILYLHGLGSEELVAFSDIVENEEIRVVGMIGGSVGELITPLDGVPVLLLSALRVLNYDYVLVFSKYQGEAMVKLMLLGLEYEQIKLYGTEYLKVLGGYTNAGSSALIEGDSKIRYLDEKRVKTLLDGGVFIIPNQSKLIVGGSGLRSNDIWDGGSVCKLEQFLDLSVLQGDRYDQIVVILDRPLGEGLSLEMLLEQCTLRLNVFGGAFLAVFDMWGRRTSSSDDAGRFRKYFRFVLPMLEQDGKLCVSSDAASADCYYLREPIPPFPGIDAEETASLRLLTAGFPSLAMKHLKERGRTCGSNYGSVRYWNKLTLDWRGSRFEGRKLEKGYRGIIGLWDLRFVPHALGEYLYYLCVLKYVQSDLGNARVKVWCLAPDTSEMRFDQKDLDESIRLARVKQFGDLTAFLSHSDDSFRLFRSSEEFDQAVVDAASEWAVLPRWNSSSGGIFANYVHSFRFISQAYLKTQSPPHLFPSGKWLAWASERIGKLKAELKCERVFSVHMRYSKLDSSRNSSISEWTELFRSAASEHPGTHFLVLGEGELRGALEEMGLPENYSFSGEHVNSAMADFSLIHESDGFLGGPSGPAIVALLSPNPYLFYKYKLINELPHLQPPAPFPWAQKGQRIHWLDYDTDSLVEAFSDWVATL